MISPEEKQKFLESLQNPVLPVASASKKKSSATTVFAAGFLFFVFIIILLIFILSLSGSGNPIFQSFGIEPYEIKSFLISLVNKVFMVLTILLLLLVAIGFFRGYAATESSQKKGSFIFAGVSGALIFLSILAWGGAIAFVNKFTVEATGRQTIAILGFGNTDIITAPVDITFSASDIVSQYRRQGEVVVGLRWSKDDGKTFSSSSLNEQYTFQFFKKGIQKITLEVALKSGKIENYTRGFTVDQSTFSVNPPVPILGKNIVFDASLLTDKAGLYRWDFESDGIYDVSSRTAKTNFIFETLGQKNITLRVEGENDSVETYYKTVIVSAETDKLLDANIISVPDPKGRTPFEITFDGTTSRSQMGQIIDYSWKIEGERSIKKGTSISHVFKTAGVFTVELTVKTENGKTDTEKIEVEVLKGNSAPVAIITSRPAYNTEKNSIEGLLPFEMSLHANNSTDAEENIVEYAWKITDPSGQEVEKFGDALDHTFRSIGTHVVVLTVTDKEGEKNTKELKVLIKEPPVVPVVKVFPQSGIAPFIAEFNASESFCRQEGCKILSYEWDFGDGSPVLPSGSIVTHQFTKPGTFETKMTAITNNGEKASVLTTITVTKQPLVSCFTASRNEGTAPVKITFTPSCSQGQIAQYKWDFGDGYVSTSKIPTHSFVEAGKYTVRLHAISDDGTVSEMKMDIFVE